METPYVYPDDSIGAAASVRLTAPPTPTPALTAAASRGDCGGGDAAPLLPPSRCQPAPAPTPADWTLRPEENINRFAEPTPTHPNSALSPTSRDVFPTCENSTTTGGSPGKPGKIIFLSSA